MRRGCYWRASLVPSNPRRFILMAKWLYAAMAIAITGVSAPDRTTILSARQRNPMSWILLASIPTLRSTVFASTLMRSTLLRSRELASSVLAGTALARVSAPAMVVNVAVSSGALVWLGGNSHGVASHWLQLLAIEPLADKQLADKPLGDKQCGPECSAPVPGLL